MRMNFAKQQSDGNRRDSLDHPASVTSPAADHEHPAAEAGQLVDNGHRPSALDDAVGRGYARHMATADSLSITEAFSVGLRGSGLQRRSGRGDGSRVSDPF